MPHFVEFSTISNSILKLAGPESGAEGSISDKSSNVGGSGDIAGEVGEGL